MTTSGTYAFNPSLGELVLYAFNLAGLRNTSLLVEHFQTARMSANLLLSRWANQGVNLWAVDLVTVPLVQGTATYSVAANTVTVLDVYTALVQDSTETDRIILPISRTEYASYPNKNQQGTISAFWFDRLLAPTITLWCVPDGTSAQYLKYYRVRQIQDAVMTNGSTVEVPYLWLEAFAYALAARLAIIWNAQMATALKAAADEAYDIAAAQNIEQANMYIAPQLSGYYRP